MESRPRLKQSQTQRRMKKNNPRRSTIAKVALSILLGGAILYWMYRDFDFALIGQVLTRDMNWWWMLLSFPFGVLAQALRGWRWRMALEPMGEHTTNKVAVDAIFVSYAVSLIIPRSGEFARCGVLKAKSGVDFAKSLGTVVTERAIDSLLVMVVTGITLLSFVGVFSSFFTQTGTSLETILRGFSPTGYLVAIICVIAVAILLWFLLRKLSFYERVKTTMAGIWQGIVSLRHVKHAPLYIGMTIGIWLSYFLHYYLTFFCFDATAALGLDAALVTFIVGSIAVIVPTPNGAGPWHFAVKTMLMLYGVAATDALYFVLIVHTVQTMLVVLLGIFAWARLLKE